MNKVINLAEKRIEKAKARIVVCRAAAMANNWGPDYPDERQRVLRAHLLQEAFAEQELSGAHLNYETARQQVDTWLREANKS